MSKFASQKEFMEHADKLGANGGRFAKDSGNYIRFIKNKGEDQGYIIYEHTGVDTIGLDVVYLEKHLRKKGVMANVLQEILMYRKVTVKTFDDGIKMYKKLGFKEFKKDKQGFTHMRYTNKNYDDTAMCVLPSVEITQKKRSKK